MLQARIAGGIDAPIAGPQKIIDVDAVATVVVNAGGLQIQTVGVRHTAGAGEDGIDGDRAVVVVTDEIDDLLAVFHTYIDGASVEPYLDAIVCEGIGQYLRGVSFFPWEEERPFLHDHRPHAETAKRLRHFAAERAATDDQQAARRLGQVEGVLVGQIAGLDETGNGGRVRPCASRDQSLSEAQCRTINVQCIGSCEGRLAEEHIHASRRQPARRIGATDTRANTAHALHHCGKVDTDVSRDARTILVGTAHLGVQARGADDRLRRHAADIQTGSAEQVTLDQGDLRALCRRGMCRDQPRRTGPDNDQIVALRRRWIAPIDGTDVVHAFALGGIARKCCGNGAALQHCRCPVQGRSATASRQ